jgi:hypothetical protein
MCTATAFDLGTYDEGEGARFDTLEALVWWAEEEEEEEEEEGGGGGGGVEEEEDENCRYHTMRGCCEVINGRTGAGAGAGASAGAGAGDAVAPPAPVPGVSRAALLRVHRAVSAHVLQQGTSPRRREDEASMSAYTSPMSTSMAMSTSLMSKSVSTHMSASCPDAFTAAGYASLKRAAGASSGYAAAKRAVLSQPGLWSLSAPHHSVAR